MRAGKLSWLLNYFGRNTRRQLQACDYRLSVSCDAAIVMPLRKQLFWELHALGLRAGELSVSSGADGVYLSLRLHCPQSMQARLNELALRLSQQAQVRRVRWGRWQAASQPTAQRLNLSAI